MIELKNIRKSFHTPRGKVTVLGDFSLSVADGCFLGISGKSGAGKSTLLSIIAGLQKPDSGTVLIGGGNGSDGNLTDIFSLGDKALSAFRNRNIGFVSQEQSFLENLTVLDNVRLPFFIGSHKLAKRRDEDIDFINNRAMELLEKLGIAHLAASNPRDLSGGENHRLLIARALINNPSLILADEPTDSVDAERTEQIAGIFSQLADDGKTVILASHDSKLLESCGRVVEL
ncbi:MAG: ABC transporter ATP-binding protein [Treponema sp.]|nr:ABC transporter ATP-binding protein [Treponema sp.]